MPVPPVQLGQFNLAENPAKEPIESLLTPRLRLSYWCAFALMETLVEWLIFALVAALALPICAGVEVRLKAFRKRRRQRWVIDGQARFLSASAKRS